MARSANVQSGGAGAALMLHALKLMACLAEKPHDTMMMLKMAMMMMMKGTRIAVVYA